MPVEEPVPSGPERRVEGLQGIFVTGTDTGVGKTVVSAALLLRYREMVPRLRYWKPVQTGMEQDDDTAYVRQLTGCGDEEVLDAGIRLPRPVSPHLAARLEGVTIDVSALSRPAHVQPSSRWIVEGAGGALVPLNASELIVDLIRGLALPALVVARSTLGTINHTLLTIEALRARAIDAAGVVMVGPPDRENRQAIERYGRVAVVGELPPLEPLDSRSIGEWAARHLDADGVLRRCFDDES